MPTSLRGALVAGLATVLVACSAIASGSPPGSQSAPVTASPIETLAPTPSPLRTYAMTPAGSFDPALVDGLRTEVDVPFTATVQCGRLDCTLPLDILAPTDRESLATVVLIPGGPAAFEVRRYAELLAAGIARGGAVVFLVTYRSDPTGNPETDSIHDIRCAIRYARSVTATYGGDSDRLVVVGHSFGSQLALQLLPEETATPGCLADGDGMPEAIVGMAGFRFPPLVAGQTYSGPPLLLAGAPGDPGSAGGEAFAQRLRDAGYDASYREFEGATHSSLVDPSLTPGVLELVTEAIERVTTPAG